MSHIKWEQRCDHDDDGSGVGIGLRLYYQMLCSSLSLDARQSANHFVTVLTGTSCHLVYALYLCVSVFIGY